MTTPCAFLCHSSADKPTIRKLAADLVSKGIDVFFDEWEIGPGDSLRQKIDAGIGRCTHFVVVLSPTSLDAPWVNAELDGGFVKKVSGTAKLIPVRIGLRVDELPFLLRGLHAPTLDNYEDGRDAIIASVHGISGKPALGDAPDVVNKASRGLGRTPGAEAIIAHFVTTSEHALTHDPEVSADELRTLTQLSDKDIAYAVDELESEGLVHRNQALGMGAIGFITLGPSTTLFSRYDSAFHAWNPEHDAVALSTLLLEKEAFNLSDAANSLGWSPRRMNPAVNILLDAGAVMSSRETGTYPWIRRWIRETVKTRRFLMDRS